MKLAALKDFVAQSGQDDEAAEGEALCQCDCAACKDCVNK